MQDNTRRQARVWQPFFELLDVGVCFPAFQNQPGYTSLDGELFVFAACATPFSTTFVIFNTVPVYPGLGSSYGLRVIHISGDISALGRRHVGYVDSSLPGGSVQPARKHCS